MNLQTSKGVTPIQIAPEEIWKYIFHLLETNDLVATSLSCRSFSNFLQKKKVTFLFGKILPFTAKYLDPTSLLACRGVSRQWRLECDLFLESRAVTEISEIGNKIRLNKKYPANLLCPTLKFDIERMMEFHHSMRDHSTNPFVGRSVKLQLDELDFGAAVNDTVQLFMQTFGKHIWHFKYDDAVNPGNPENVTTLNGAYTRFKNIADAMPNLRSLSFVMDVLRNSEPGPEDGDNPLIHLMDVSPLPKLPFLESLKLEFGDLLPDHEQGISLHCPIQCQNIYHKIFWIYGQQLRRLEIQWYYWNPYFPMEYLTELRLNFFDSNKSLEWITNSMVSKDRQTSSNTQLSLPCLLLLEIEFEYYNIDIDCLMIFLQKTRKICGRFEILRINLDIPRIEAGLDDAIFKCHIVLAEMPADFDSELDWLRYILTKFLKESKQTYLIDLGRMVAGEW